MQSGSSHKGAKISWSLLSVGKVIHRLLDITCRQKTVTSVDFCHWHEDWCEGNCSLRQEGVRGLWRGGLPTAQRAALVAGVQVFNVVLILCWFVTLLGGALLVGVLTLLLQLPVYDASKAQLLAHGVKDGAGCHLAARWAFLDFWTHLQCLKLFELFPLLIIIFSFLAGLSACIASNPVDVVRTRMMVQRKTARYDLHQKNYPITFCK